MENRKNIWSAFEQKIYLNLKDNDLLKNFYHKKILILVSGGKDSMALLNVIFNLNKKLKSSIQVLTFHHGKTKNVQQLNFRDEAMELVEKECLSKKINFNQIKYKEKIELKNELEFRRFRTEEINKWISSQNIDFVLTGHHRNDLLETRLIRLIRGTGLFGLKAMTLVDKKTIRPFINIYRSEIDNYVKLKNIKFIEDPSNLDQKYLRNWVRNTWLVELENYQSGAIKSLERSLGQILEKRSFDKFSKLNFKRGILRQYYSLLTYSEKAQILAYYLKFLGVKDFRHTQVKELIKNLDRNQNDHTFIMAHLVWSVNAKQILAQPK